MLPPEIDAKLIKVDIVQGDLEQRLPWAEFRELLVQEIGSVTLTMTRKQFRLKIESAADRVLQRICDAAANP